jgi:hypothetical protein
MGADSVTGGKTYYAGIADLGRKIGIPNLAVEDFDLIFADPHGVHAFCDKLNTIELTQAERFHFVQLIVASLDMAMGEGVFGAEGCDRRVEQLLLKDLGDYKYIIDYWGRPDTDLRTVPMMLRLKNDLRYIYTGGDAPFE